MIGNILTGAALLLALAVHQSPPPQLSADLIETLSPSTQSEVQDLVRQLAGEPNNAGLLGRIGMILQANQKLELAIQYYDQALQIEPDQFPWVYYRAICNQSLRNLEEAERDFRQASNIDPGYIPAQLHLGQLLADGGRWEEAAQVYQKIVDQLPDLAIGHFGLARSLEGLGQMDEAEQNYRQACRLHPSYGAAHYGLAQLLKKKGDQDGAREQLGLYQQNRLVQPVVGDGLLQAIDELKSGHPKALQLIGEAVSEAEQGHTEKAIDLNLEAIEISPGLAQAYVNLLILYGQEKRFEEADKIYKKGIEAAPNFGKLYYNYGVLLLERNRPVEAYDVLLKAIQVNPLNASARINLGRIEEMKGDLSEAERQYREAISAKPDLRLAHFNLARMLIARNQPSEGAAELEKLRTPEDDQTPLYLYALSAARVREGQLEEALEVAEEARTLAEKYNRDDLLPAINRDLAALRAKLKK